MRELLQEQLKGNIKQSTPALFIIYTAFFLFMIAILTCIQYYIYDIYLNLLIISFIIGAFLVYFYLTTISTIQTNPIIFLVFVSLTLTGVIHSSTLPGIILLYIIIPMISCMYANTKIQIYVILSTTTLTCISIYAKSTNYSHNVNEGDLISIILLLFVTFILTYIVTWRIQGLFRMQIVNEINQLSQFNIDLVHSLLLTIDAKDAYTRGHSERVSQYATEIAKLLPHFQNRKKLQVFQYTVLLHDIGKIQLPDHILLKEGRLTEEEFSMIQQHTTHGAAIVQKIRLLENMYASILCHHERWDGNGYPLGLKEDSIPLEARIIAIADSFDAMTSNRPYRGALSVEEAFKRLVDGRSTQYDPSLIDLLPQYKDTFIHIFNECNEQKVETA